MSVKIAIEIIDQLIKGHLKCSKAMRENTKDWSDGPGDLARTIAEVQEDIVKSLIVIKMNIQPKCKHPKKMRDGKPGKRYCMNCNLDMDD